MDLVAPFRLEINDLGDRRREITYEVDDRLGTRTPVTTLWTRKLYFSHRGTVYKNVYLDECKTTGKLRAVKEIYLRPKGQGKTTGASANECLELKTMARVVRDVGHDYTRLFVGFLGWFDILDGVSLVLEYCALGDIDQCFAKPVPESLARAVAVQVLEGIAVLHGLGITHRDIKPQNILVAQKDPLWVKIADFGVSKYTDGRTDLRSRVGTPEYMAPELLFDSKRESSYSNAVDMWSLGCLLYYMLTKQLPFPELQQLNAFWRGDIPFPESCIIEKSVGRSCVAFIKLLMRPMPEDRPQASVDLLKQWDVVACEGQGRDAELEGQPQSEFHRIEEAVPVTAYTATNQAGQGAFLTSESISQTETRWLSDSSTSQLPMDYWSSELLAVTSTPSLSQIDPRRTRALLESGADPNRMRNGYTALHHAAKQASSDTVQLLLEYGADTSFKTAEHHETALHLATHRGDSASFLKVLPLLAARGVDINAQDSTGNTVLHMAIARLRDVRAVEALLDLGARKNILGRGGLAPLLYALGLDREDKARVLLDGGADPNAPRPDGRRPLHVAISSEKISMGFIERLVECGADVNEMDDEGVSPLHEAVKRGRTDVVHFLIERGADCSLGSASSSVLLMEKRLQWMRFKRSLPWPLQS
ncbi:kinase-like domain-containing protein [Aspergillus undulatus]|uniref:kinase-like domain-containing protein n=1 Tax=Aspergillus undulatus TaxID=1810928 RepID=UPI003CCD889D